MKNIGQVCCLVASCNITFIEHQKSTVANGTLTPSLLYQNGMVKRSMAQGKAPVSSDLCLGTVAAIVPGIGPAKVRARKVHS